MKPEYDAATVNWGPNWRMPTETELKTITTGLATTYKPFTTINGVSGRKIVDKDDATKYIFLPAAGFANEDGFTISGSGKYASSTLTTSDVSEFYLDFTSTSCLIKSAGCYVGRTIRPVYIGE